MSSWDFRREKNQDNTGSTSSNPSGGLKAGFQPFPTAGSLASKRNVIATEKGWVRRIHRNNNDGSGTRQIDEILVAANPAASGGYAADSFLGNPDIAQIYLADSSNIPLTSSTIANNTSFRAHVVFNEPIKYNTAPASGKIKLTFTNVANSSITMVAQSTVSNSNTGIRNANNTLIFAFTSGPAGSYKINAQTLSNATSTAVSLLSLNNSESANLVVTGAVSNSIGTIIVSA